MKKLLFSCLASLSLIALNAQCSVIEVPLAQRASASTLIVEGQVTSQYSYWNTSQTMIYTAHTIELYKIFKGNVATSSIEIITEGGTVGLKRISVEPMLELKVGDVGMFTCEPVKRAKNSPVSRGGLPQFEAFASMQGFVKYNPETNTATDPFRTYNDVQTEVYNVCAPAGKQQYRTIKTVDVMSTHREQQQFMAGPSISSFSPTTITAGTTTVLTIDGTSFGVVQAASVVRFRNADDGGATQVEPLASEYVSWSSTQIKVRVPANAGTGTIEVFTGASGTSASPLTISYAHLNVIADVGNGDEAFETDHINNNGSGGYTWQMNTGFDADAPARASFMRAFDSWRCNTGINWSIGATTAINDAVSDGLNIICYDNAAPLPGGVLGVCYSYWNGCANGPTIAWFVDELDIIFDEGSNIAPLTWEFGPSLPGGSEYDFETVAVHELGHGHQLGHVIQPGAIMHYAISNGTSNRSLGVNDLAGGTYVQGKSVVANVCGPGAMSSMSCGSAPVAAFGSDVQTVCEGGQVVFDDQSTNVPTSWVWNFTGGSPSSSTAQNPTITYNTAGTYAVSLTATNASGSDPVTINSYITVVGNPTVGFTSSPANGIICAGQPATLSGSGAVSYLWTGGVTNGVPFSPPSTASYTVTGTNANGCQGTATATITVNQGPSLNIVSNPVSGPVCNGNQATLTASGAVGYSWTGGITNGVPFTPLSTATYTVTGTAANGCTSTAQRVLTVQSCNFQTQLTAASCGSTGQTLSGTVYATTVSGATNYEFRFVNASLSYSQSRVKGNGIANVPLSWIPGLQYGVTYDVQVRCYINSAWQAYGPVCTVSLAAQIPTTQLTNCAATNLTLSSSLSVTSVAGAQNYQYEVTNAQQPYSQAIMRNSTTTSIGLTWFPNLQYGRTYNVRVRAMVGNVWGAYGPTCTFAMQASSPSTLLAASSCGATGLTATSVLSYNAVVGATNYQVNIVNALGYNQTRARGNNGTTMSLSTFSGLTNGSYTVTVRSYIGGQWGTFGPPCTITLGSARMSDPSLGENQPMFGFAMSMYPNPLGDNVNPTLNITGADGEVATVNVVDINGRVVTTYELNVEGDDYTTVLAGFPDLVAGIYFMQVQVGNEVQNQKFIAQ